MKPLQVLLNPAAGMGRARERFRPVEDGLWKLGVPFDLHEVAGGELAARVDALLAEGHRDLVAAGGDGTLCALVDHLMSLPPATREAVTVGVIGIGTQNTFLEPAVAARWFEKTQVLLDSERPASLAIHRLDHDGGATHFLQNSSAGLMARGSAWMNRGWVRWLAGLHYGAVMQAVSLVNVLTHGGIHARVRAGDREEDDLFEGITLLRRPAVGPGIFFRTDRDARDPLFDVVCLRKVTPGELQGILESFAREGPREGPNVALLRGEEVELEFGEPTLLEYDGETLTTTRARYRVVHGALRRMGDGVPA